jgi:hypothetical protein
VTLDVKGLPSPESHPDDGTAPGGAPGPPPRSTARIAVSLVILALIAGSIGFWLLRSGPPTGNPPAPPAPSVIIAGGLSPGPGSVVPVDAIIFRWTPVQGAVRYEISLQDSGGTALLHLTVPGTEYSARWPKDKPPPPPGHMVWRIQAFSAQSVITNGRPIAFQAR